MGGWTGTPSLSREATHPSAGDVVGRHQDRNPVQHHVSSRRPQARYGLATKATRQSGEGQAEGEMDVEEGCPTEACPMVPAW